MNTQQIENALQSNIVYGPRMALMYIRTVLIRSCHVTNGLALLH